LRWRFVGRAGAWGERGGGAGRIIVLDDPGGAFAVRWVLALLGWADANVLCQFELEFRLEFDSVEVFEFVDLGGLGCPLKAVKFALFQDKTTRILD